MTDLAAEWARCKPWIEPALEYGSFGYEIDDVWNELNDPSTLTQLWPGHQAAIVTQIWVFPRARAVNFWLAGGDLTELTTAMRPCIETWAKGLGCTHSIIAGRPGWGRALRDEGYEPAWSALKKELT